MGKISDIQGDCETKQRCSIVNFINYSRNIKNEGIKATIFVFCEASFCLLLNFSF
jgi:hypothetical protein